jgi:hypothetical protein
MPAEPVAHRGQELVPEGRLLARPETVLQGHRDDGEGNPRLDRLDRRPAALAGIGHVRRDPVQAGVLRQRVGRQVQQPGADHAAVLPDFGDPGQVQAELAFPPHQPEPLGIRLHQPVFDPVVDHLDEMPGPARPDAPPRLDPSRKVPVNRLYLAGRHGHPLRGIEGADAGLPSPQ